jgi:BASS family bile acid:Na+ symporter
MTPDALVRLGLILSIWLIALSLGASASAQSAISVVRRPGASLRAFLAVYVAVPAFAVFVAATAPIPAAIKFVLVAMTVGPVPPTLPFKQMKAGGDRDYAVGLLVAASLSSIVLTPLLVSIDAAVLGAQASVRIGHVARIVVLSIGLPLAAGLLLRAASKRFAEIVQAPAQRIGIILLLLVVLLMLGTAWRNILDLLGNGAALAIAATVAVALLAGHLLGGGRHSASLALAAASRHPGVALVIAQINYPNRTKEIMAAILLFLLITAIVTAPYVRWIRARAAHLETSTLGQD